MARWIFPVVAMCSLLAVGCDKDGDTAERGPGNPDDDTPYDPDNDGDGHPESDDCDDNDPEVYPGAPERCNGIDDDCDEVVPENETDKDGDGVIECEEECGSGPGGGSISTLGDCEYTPEPSGTPFAVQVEWSMANALTDPSSGAAVPAYEFDFEPSYGGVFNAPVVGQTTDDNGDGKVDRDDIPDLVVVMGDIAEHEIGVMRLISGDGSTVHAATRLQSHTNANGTHEYGPYHYAGAAIGNVDSDPEVEIVTIVSRSSDGACYPAIYEVDESGSDVNLVLERVYGGGDYYCAAHAPNLADIDDDGIIEIILGKNALEADDLSLDFSAGPGRGWYGDETYGSAGYWNSGYMSFPYDLDGDGAQMEVVAGRTVYTSAGGTYCELGWYEGETWVAARDGYPAVADLLRFSGDTLGEPEIVITGNEYISVFHGVTDYDPNGLDRCVLIDALPNDPADDPTVSGDLPDHPNCDDTRKSFGGPPNVADFDGDGDMDLGVAGACWFSIYHWDERDSMTFKRMALAQTKDWSSASTGSTVFDFNGDGEDEIVFSDEEALYVWGYDSSAGLDPWERLDAVFTDDFNHKSWTIHEYPVVADTDGDGKAEIVVVNSHLPGHEDHYGLYVYGAADDDWVSARKVWNQHAYYVTSIADDLEIGYCDPNYAPYTSEDYNSFRQQRPGDFGEVAAPNLFVAAEAPCQEGCGPITVWLQVGNEGEHITVDGSVPVSIYGVNGSSRTLLVSSELGDPVAPGELTDGIGFEIDGWDAYDHLVAVIDDPELGGAWGWGSAKECDEDDNEAVIDLDGLCP